MRTFFKTFVSKETTIWRFKKSQSNYKLLEKDNVFQLSHEIKKHSLKQVASITNTVKKKFFAAATFEGL